MAFFLSDDSISYADKAGNQYISLASNDKKFGEYSFSIGLWFILPDQILPSSVVTCNPDFLIETFSVHEK